MSKATNRQVEAFRAVMLTGSMTSAAELLGVTQPAVSRMIGDFEAIAKLSLFDRRPNHIVPTADAIALYGEVERSFVGLNRILDYARALKTQTAGEVSVAAMPAFATEVLPRFAGRFLNSRPDARVRMEAFSSVSVVEAVASGEVDIGYTMAPPDRPGFEVTPLGGNAVVVMPESHRLSSKTEILSDDLNGENVIGSYGSIFQSRVDLALAGVDRFSRVETKLSHVACVMVSEGQGLTIADPYTAGMFKGRGVVLRPFRPEIQIEFALITLTKRNIAPLAKTFIFEFSDYLGTLRDL